MAVNVNLRWSRFIAVQIMKKMRCFKPGKDGVTSKPNHSFTLGQSWRKKQAFSIFVVGYCHSQTY